MVAVFFLWHTNWSWFPSLPAVQQEIIIIIFVDEMGKNSRKMHRTLLSQITEVMITVSWVSGLLNFFHVYKKTNFYQVKLSLFKRVWHEFLLWVVFTFLCSCLKGGILRSCCKVYFTSLVCPQPARSGLWHYFELLRNASDLHQLGTFWRQMQTLHSVNCNVSEGNALKWDNSNPRFLLFSSAGYKRLPWFPWTPGPKVKGFF